MKISKKILSILLTIAIVVNMISITAIPTSALNGVSFKGEAHISNVGWLARENELGIMGRAGEGNSLEAFKITGVSSGNIQYQAHVSNIGWQNYVSSGAIAGTTGQGKAIEAVRIRVVNMQGYSVFYRAYISGKGWSKWEMNGNTAGTTGQGKPIEAIQIFVTNSSTFFNARVITDWSGINNAADNAYVKATTGFIKEFGFVFNLVSSTTNSSVLSGACPNTSVNRICILNPSFCGLRCNEHHKGGSRILNLLRTNTIYTCRVVQYMICNVYENFEHNYIRGVSYANNRDSLVSALVSQYESTIQHELSHNLGVTEHCDTKNDDKCVMKKITSPKREINKWCNDCSKKIK